MITVSANMIQYPGDDPVVTTGSCRPIVPNASWSTSVVPDEPDGRIECIIGELIRCIRGLAVGVLRPQQVPSASHMGVEGADCFSLQPRISFRRLLRSGSWDGFTFMRSYRCFVVESSLTSPNPLMKSVFEALLTRAVNGIMF